MVKVAAIVWAVAVIAALLMIMVTIIQIIM